MAQPLLHDAEIVLAAPGQVWSRPDGSMHTPLDGVHVSDVRVLAGWSIDVAGSAVEHIATNRERSDVAVFTAVLRGFDSANEDPRLRLDVRRIALPDGAAERLTLTSGLPTATRVTAVLRLEPDLTPMPVVKEGGRAERPAVVDLGWSDADMSVRLHVGAGVRPAVVGDVVELHWHVDVPARGTASIDWRVVATDRSAVVAAPTRRIPLHAPASGLPALDAWTATALADLVALQLELAALPGEVFLAAGAPWFLTLFGRDSIWAARLLLPIDTRLALGTLRVLAATQGRSTDPETGERPGGVVHELRRAANPLVDGTVLPPRYYGTIDATPLWILLLHDAWRAGLQDDEVRELLPHLRAALGWLRDAVPANGFLSYQDESGHGLANQGWKDSHDSVQWADGTLAAGPIALCEVQGYAHEAALAAARLLDAFGTADDRQEATGWLRWAASLKARFRTAFWVEDGQGGFPAIALDAAGAAVDSLTSNIGHLLGTGILDAADEARIAALLVDPRLDSGLGLRTLATDAGGYWPLSYHGGSVWAHDTAIAIRGLIRSGHRVEAARLADGLLAAAVAFRFRMPELHAGDADAVIPYPAACRPQAWSAAAAIAVRDALIPTASADEPMNR